MIDKKVYDVSQFMIRHPGGRWIILAEGGKDATQPFTKVVHTPDAIEQLY